MKKHLFSTLLAVLSLSSHAQIQWAQATWGNQEYFLKVDPVGNCYMAVLAGDSATYQNIRLPGGAGVSFAKYNTNGKLLWAGQTSGPVEEVYANAFDKYGNHYVAGDYTYEFTAPDVMVGSLSIPFNGAGDNIFLVKLDTGGNAIWLKGVGGMNSNYVADLAADTTGNVYLIGSYDSPFTLDGVPLQSYGPGGFWGNYFLAKFDGSGGLLWIDSSICQADSKLKINNSGDMFFAGSFYGALSCHDTMMAASGYAIYIEKQNSQGVRQWLVNTGKSRGGDQHMIDFYFDKENNVYCLAYLPDSFVVNDTSMILPHSNNYVFCLDPNGNFKWVNKVPGWVNTNHIYISPDDSLHAISESYTYDTIWYSPDSIEALVPQTDTFTDYVMAKANGSCSSPRQLFAVTGYTTGSIKCDSHGNLYYCGGYQNYASVGSDSFGNGWYGCFLAKCLSPGYNGIVPEVSPSFAVAPNPVNSYFQIMPGRDGVYSSDIIDLSGRIIATYTNLSGAVLLPAGNLASGVYTIRVRYDDGYSLNARIVKE